MSESKPLGNIVREEDGREYRVVSDGGLIVKVVNGGGREMAFSVGALYPVRKATPEPLNGKANPAPVIRPPLSGLSVSK